MQLRLQGMPMPKDKIPPPAIPRGFKMGSILPLHSPALSGGGVNDNFLKDMMEQMGAGGGGGLAGMPGMADMAGLAGMAGGGGGGGSGAGNAQQKKVKVIRKK